MVPDNYVAYTSIDEAQPIVQKEEFTTGVFKNMIAIFFSNTHELLLLAIWAEYNLDTRPD